VGYYKLNYLNVLLR